MVRFIFPLLILFTCTSTGWAQKQTGFYLTTPCSDESEQLHEMMGSDRVVCLVNEPIVALKEVAAIGELAVVGHDVTFTVHLTSDAYKKLKVISTSISKTSLALVIDKEVFVVIGANEIKSASTYQFYGKLTSLSGIKHYYGKLKTEFDQVQKTKSD